MDENNSLSEYIKSHFVTNAPMAPFTPKSISKLRSALRFLHFTFYVLQHISHNT